MPFNPKKPYNDLPLLPPKRDKIETIEVLRQDSRARAALAELKGIAELIPNQSILINAVVIREAKDSSEIENIITTQDALYRALASNLKITDPTTKEVLNYRESLFKGYKEVRSKGYLKVNDIIKIQSQIVENNAGVRANPGTVLKNDATGETVYTPPEDKDALNKLLSNLAEYFNVDDDDLSPLIKMSVIHYQFESIHPFYDGNGRTGRILNILYLILKELLDTPILYLSSYIIKNKKEYYRLLREVTVSKKWDNWVLYMLKGVEEVASETIDKVRQIKKLLDKTILKVKAEAPKKVYSKELIELLFEHPYCKIEFLVTRLEIDRKTASGYLKELVKINVLTPHKVGKETIFINKELFNLLKK